jgi:tRNA(adenine34) deaminase
MTSPKRPPLGETDVVGMRAALGAARQGGDAGEIPVGAAVIARGTLVATAHNETIAGKDLTQHAELIAMRRALSELDVDRLDAATLYVTLEPCAQCAGSMVLARLGRVMFGAYDPKAGMAGTVGDLLRHPKLNHRPEVIGGVMEEECGALLKAFFEERREEEKGGKREE